MRNMDENAEPYFNSVGSNNNAVNVKCPLSVVVHYSLIKIYLIFLQH
jgi:hypothetical protein